MNKGRLAVPALTLVVLLAGCSSVNELLGNEESIDYKGAGANRTKPLSIPPRPDPGGERSALSDAGFRLHDVYRIPAARR